ncbi:hypothetical protein ES319_1Z077100v1, partial [Gossypium barbadense]
RVVALSLFSLLGFVGVFRPASSLVLSSWFLLIGWVEVWLIYFLGVDPGCVVLLDSTSRLLLKVSLFYFPLILISASVISRGCKWTVNGLFNLGLMLLLFPFVCFVDLYCLLSYFLILLLYFLGLLFLFWIISDNVCLLLF